MSVPLEVWQHTIDVTLTGYMYGIRHALPLLIERGSGAIVNTSSSSVWMGETEHVAYQSAKSGLTGRPGIPPLSVESTACAATSWHPA